MPFATAIAGAALALSGGCNGINILMGNDDGFGSGNLRQLYDMLTDAGHNGECAPLPSQWKIDVVFSLHRVPRASAKWPRRTCRLHHRSHPGRTGVAQLGSRGGAFSRT